MLDLRRELEEFQYSVNKDVLNGFNEYAKAVRTHMHGNAYDFFIECASGMREYALINNADGFYTCRSMYYSLFKELNIAMASTIFEDCLGVFDPSQFRPEEARIFILCRLWESDARIKKWLPNKIKMNYSDYSDWFYVVGHPMHINPGELYITPDMFQYLKQNRHVDPRTVAIRKGGYHTRQLS